MRILYQTADWLAIDKPTGVSTHGAWEGDLGVSEWLALHLALQTHVVSRLDKETSGVLILAKNPGASARAEHIHSTAAATKTYEMLLAAQKGTKLPTQWECREPIDGKAAQTTFSLVAQVNPPMAQSRKSPQQLFHVRAQITAGKKHQIRRHAAWSGYPILGDTVYGGPSFPRLCLHCAEVSWPELEPRVTSPLHPSMAALVSGRTWPECATLAAADRRWGALDSITDAMRLLHRHEGQGDYALDRFGSSLCAWLYNAADESACRSEAKLLAKVFGLNHGVLKKLHRDPHHKGALCETTPLFGNPPKTERIREHELYFNVDLSGNEQTGFFLDQRDNRRRISILSEKKRIANLFAYTCSFTVCAAQSNPEVIFSVDISRSALREGISNLKENNLEKPTICKFVEEDCRTWIERQLRKQPRQPFHVVVCDPPTFGKTAQARGKARAFRIAVEWQNLARDISTLLSPDGTALFCCNNQQLTTVFLEEALQRHFKAVTRTRLPLDFPEDIDPVHNRMFWCQGPHTRHSGSSDSAVE